MLAGLLSTTAFSQKASLNEITLKDARTAFRNYDPILAVEILENLWKSPQTSLTDRISAGKYSSSLHSKFLNDFDKAKEVIEQTIQLDSNDTQSYLRFSQIASTFNKHDLALENAQLSIIHAHSKVQKIAAYSSYGKILLKVIIERIKDGPLVDELAIYNLDKNQIIDAVKQLNRVIQEDPEQQELLKTKFALEILAGEGKRALNSWKQYFNFSEESNPLLKTTYVELEKSLENWNGSDSDIEKRKSLAKALATARNFDLSMVIMKTIRRDQILADNRLREIENYNEFLGNIKTLTASFYRSTALRESNPDEYRNSMILQVKKLWGTFTWGGVPPEFSLDHVESEIDKRFGAVIRIGNANGWFSLTWGHKVIEYERTIEQYGIKADIIFRSLDYLISNGFNGWYNNNSGIIGGWQSDNIVYQVRPTYLTNSYNAWINSSDSLKIKAWNEKIKNGIEEDRLLEKNAKTVIFTGMLAKINYKWRRDLFNDLTKDGFKGEDLKNKYMFEYETLTFENEIIAHEGRHLIDHKIIEEKQIKLTPDQLEYRAKLSEIAFAKYPFMALSSILEGGISNSPHGIANEKLINGLYDWIEENWNKVRGIDSNLPKGSQLDLLTNEQLIGIIKAMDPLVPTK